MTELNTKQLRVALQLSEQIDTLQERLAALLGQKASAPAEAPPTTRGPGKSTRKSAKRVMSPEGRARIAAAAKARWAKLRGAPAQSSTKAQSKAPAKRRSPITPEGRARIAAAMKARWAARKSGGAGGKD